MLSKMSMKNIILDFFAMLNVKEKWAFILVPFFVSIILACFIKFNNSTVEIFIVVLSIFVALLLNLLVVAIPLKNDEKEIEVGNEVYNIQYFLKRFNNAVCFGIFVAIINILELFIHSFEFSNNHYIIYVTNRVLELIPCLTQIFSSGFFIYLLNLLILWAFLSFVITLFIILKRTHIMVGFYLED